MDRVWNLVIVSQPGQETLNVQDASIHRIEYRDCWFRDNKQRTNDRRLDSSAIAPSEIDATVSRLMRAAEVTAISIAILNDGKIAYLKSYGVHWIWMSLAVR